MIKPARYFRKIITVPASMSPNVRYGFAQEAAGEEPTDEMLYPGVLPYSEFKKREQLWDDMRKCVCLYARFYEGAETLMFPSTWIEEAEKRARSTTRRKRAKSMGVDSAEGGDNTVWALADDHGLLELVQKKTKDTSVICGDTIALMREWGVDPSRVMFDAGGGGLEHVHYIRQRGYDVQSVRFGTAATAALTQGFRSLTEREEAKDVQYAYISRRVEMYHLVSMRIDPAMGGTWAIPTQLLDRARSDGKATLRRQMAKIPKRYDDRGRMVLPSKTKRDGLVPEQSTDRRKTLIDLIGCSPDELEAVILASWGLKDSVGTTQLRTM